MPIFEFKCLDCGASFEKLRKESSSELPPCPHCGSVETQKEFSSFAAIGGSKSAASTSPASCFTGG